MSVIYLDMATGKVRESDEDFAARRVKEMLLHHCDIRRIALAQERAKRRVRCGINRRDAIESAIEWAFSPQEPPPKDAA